MSPIPGIKGLVHGFRFEDETGAHSAIQALLTETEKLLESWKHPDPYTPPTAPGGKVHQRAYASEVIQHVNTILQVPSTSETFHHPFSTVSICLQSPSNIQTRN